MGEPLTNVRLKEEKMEPVEDVIDRVGKAIYEARNGHGCKPWARLTHSHRGEYTSDARAAITSLKELKVECRDRDGLIHEVRGAPQDIWDLLMKNLLTSSEQRERP